MAERRMFAKTIVLSDAFLDMPLSTRCLYFTLGMVADDDGFVNSPRSIMRQCGSSQDDMNLLLAKKFIIGFDNGIIVIKHWRIHNYIQKDRYIPTKYDEQKQMLSLDKNNAYTLDTALLEEIVGEPFSDARQKRLEEYKNSDLPYSFSYKIRNAFIGEKCPVCGREMGVVVKDDDDPIISKSPMPTIQHNIPISKGGKHNIDNISVICSECNSSIQNKETGKLNNELVKKKWKEICDVSGMYTQDSIVKDSIVKDNIPPLPPKGKSTENKIDFETLIIERGFEPILEESIREWIEYKKQKKDKYTEIGFKKFLTRIEKEVSERGVDRMIADIDMSMENNYKGIVYGLSDKKGFNQGSNSQGRLDWIDNI